jgi:hypothetical protein
VRRCVGQACSLEHFLTLGAWRKSGRLIADLCRPISEAIFEGNRLLVMPPLQHGAAPVLGAGGSATSLSATGAYENVTLPAVKRECSAARMVAQGTRRNTSDFYGLIEVLTQLSPLSNAPLCLKHICQLVVHRAWRDPEG